MRRQEPDLRLLCCASIIALSLGACSHHGGKLKDGSHLTDNAQPASTAGQEKVHPAQSSRTGGRWLHGKSKSLVSRSSQYDNLWDRLFDLYDLPPIEHEEIDRELAWFINHPTYIERVQDRAEPFLYSIVKQVEKHDIPGEIALLPVIESAFQPHAVSPANAAGIWQFIPSTGRLYGLKRSHTYDGRRDVYASTKAAIKYLKKLHKEFDGDWLLAIAAYNCGEGAVGRAIERNSARGLPTDFWSLDLPQETRSYVPRLLAVAKLFVGADQYGVVLHDIPNTAQFKPVKVTTQLDLALAADAANMPLDQLYALNPGFKGKFADVEGSYHLFIPARKKAAEFRQELERLVVERRLSPEIPPALEVRAKLADFSEREQEQLAAAKPLESFPEAAPDSSRFSSAYSERSREQGSLDKKRVLTKEPTIKAQEEESWKTRALGKKPPERRAQGESLGNAPRRSALAANVPRVIEETPVKSKNQDRSTKKATYEVLPGETLWAVARKHTLDVRQLAQWNNISENTKVQAGQNLVLWNKDAAKKLPPVATGIRSSQSISYTVKAGDTLFSISRRFNVSVADLRRTNGTNVDKKIQPGRSITVPKEK